MKIRSKGRIHSSQHTRLHKFEIEEVKVIVSTNIMNSKFMLLVFSILFACSQISGLKSTHEEAQKTFLYFAYGSNMNTERMHKNNPSAKQIAIARLQDYRLDFIGYSEGWHGSVATIVETDNSEAWGVIWEIDTKDMANLDKQEGVDVGDYFVKHVAVQTSNGEYLVCRSYQQTQSPNEYAPPNELPPERQPSPAYLNTIVEGADEYNLPSYYLVFLKSFRHNNYEGAVEIP